MLISTALVCDLCAHYRASIFIARKAAHLTSCGSRTRLVHISLGRDPETEIRKYHNKTITGWFAKHKPI
jgi:hypothetical protein